MGFLSSIGADIGGFLGEITGASGIEEAAQTQAAAQLAAGQRAEALLTPYLERAEVASGQLMTEMGLAPGEAGTAYMQTPGYQATMKARQQEVQQAAAGGGTLYSGRRIEEAGRVGEQVQSQYYQNYMNMLTKMASPQPAVAAGGLITGSQQAASEYMMGGASAQQAAIGDIIGGATQVASGAYAGGYI